MLIPPEIYAEIQELIELQERLYDLREQNYSEFMEYLSNSPFQSNEDYVRKLLLCIYSAFRFNFKNTSILCRILIEIKDSLKKYLTSDEIVMNLRNNAARVALFECGVINIESILKDAHFNFFCFRFFYPEIKAYDEKFYETMLRENRSLQKSMSYLVKDEALHKKLRRLGKSEHKITQIIRDDDIDAFQDYVSLQNYALTEQIPYSVYDTNDFANNEEKMPYLVECSAFYGSIKIFKYIFMSLQSMSIELPTTLSSFAVAGGNYDIIHIVEEHLKKSNNKINVNPVIRFNLKDDSDDDDLYIDRRINELQAHLMQIKNRNINSDQINYLIAGLNDERKKLSSFSRHVVIQAAIEFHRNNVLDYIIENYSPKAEKLLKSNKTFNACITFLNFYQMLEFLTSDEDKDKVSSSEENTDSDIFENNCNEDADNVVDDNHNDKSKENENSNQISNNDNDQNIDDEIDSNGETCKKIENKNSDDDENENNKDDENENNDDDENENSNDDENEDNNDNDNENENYEPWVFDINLTPKNGLPPLIQSVSESRVDVVRFLLYTKDIDVNITTSEGCSPLIFASMYGSLSIVKLLCETKYDEINFNQEARDGSTAFSMACSYGWLNVVQYLASLKRKVNKSSKSNGAEDNSNDDENNNQANKNDGKKDNDEENSDDLIEFIFDINKTNKRGYSPFFIACMRGHIEIVKFLAEFDTLEMIQNGFFPDQIAKQFNHQNVTDFLNSNQKYIEQKKANENNKVAQCNDVFYSIVDDDDSDDDD